MKYIDKKLLRGYFDAYTKMYLHEASQGGTFVPALSSKTTYQNFNVSKYKDQRVSEDVPFDGWLAILMTEQDSRCCYCMRRIENKDVSVEHLVPETLPKGKEEEEYNYYASISPEIKDYVMTGQAFDQLAKETDIDIERLKKMPHLIAHSNLFPACNTKNYTCSCNCHRGNDRILPLMLLPDIEEKVNYTEEGEMELLYPETEDNIVEKTEKALDINSKRLKSIRKLWCRFSKKGMFFEWNRIFSYPEMDDVVRRALDLTTSDIIPLEFQDLMILEKDGTLKNFQLFLQYNWFYTYYLNKYPLQQP